jgi:predicted RND superfamily exporter protein
MAGNSARRYADVIATRSKLVIVCLLVVTAIVTAGMAMGDSENAGIGQFEVDSPETAALDQVRANYSGDQAIVSQVVVRDEGGDVLTRESLLTSLRFQQDVRANETVNGTLQGSGFVGIENVVATAAMFQASDQPPAGTPSLDEQIQALDGLSEAEFEQLLATVLDPDADLPGTEDPYQFLPTSYEPGATTADSRLTLLFQTDDSGEDAEPLVAYDSQVTVESVFEEQFADGFVFGQGISNDASNRAVGDSFAIITPVALVLILLVLGITYRDVLDVILGFVGIVVVLLWQAGIMGWLSIPMSQLLIAVPFLLIGLSIDYALHVVMRYREARTPETDRSDESEATDGTTATDGGHSADADGDDEDATSDDDSASEIGVREGMSVGLSGVVLALAAATFSTGVGFLSNVVSPLPAIRDFALLSAGGILATFVVFAALVPALKVELDGLLESRLGWDRRKRAFGVGGGVANSLLSRVAALVSRAPLAVIVVALVLATAGSVGATTIDTEFNEADFLPRDPPEWTNSLPGPLQPGTYTIADDFAYLSENFQLQGPGDQSQIRIHGEITDPAVLSAIDSATSSLDEDGALALRPDGTATGENPATVVRQIAADNETVAAAIDARDDDGDGLPDEDVAAVYDLLFEADSEAASNAIYRTDEGTYESMRVILGVRGEASSQVIASDTRDVATAIENEAPVTAIATGAPVSTAVIQDALLETLVQAFAVTLVVILLFLVTLYWVRYREPILGALTLAPVVVALCWLLGTMALLGIPFNSETAVITSLAIGLGVDYSIHVGERFAEEDGDHALDESLRRTITGTGGALLGSATTTAGGFGVLALALAPPLRRFGLVTGIAIVFAFVACVTLLPCLLVVRERVADRFAS